MIVIKRNYLKELRKSTRTSQSLIAKKIGYTQTSYCAIENGERQKDMSYSMMAKLAEVFDVPVQTIIDAETEYKKQRNTSETYSDLTGNQ